MKRSLFLGVFIIVEGPSDSRLYKKFFLNNSFSIIPAFAKETALEALKILEEDGFEGVIAIVDSDFWRIDLPDTLSDNVFITDSHDLETMIISSPALENVLHEFGSDDKIKKYEKNSKRNVREELLNVAEPIGFLRLISSREGLNINFENLSFNNFISRKNLEINISKLLAAVRTNSKEYKTTDAKIISKLIKLISFKYEPWQICCGHDVASALSIGLRSLFGSRDEKEVETITIRQSLRLSYIYSFFRETFLFKELFDWEENNNQYNFLIK